MTKFIKHSLFALSLFALLFTSAPNAHAGFLDWLNGTDKTPAVAIAATESFITPGNSFALISYPEKLDPATIENIFLLANRTPAKNPKLPAKNIAWEITVPITAYSSTPDQTDDSPFITARGTYVRDGIVAANFLPFGTKLKIPAIYGDKVFVVEDRMNKRYWHKVDIWFPDRASALNFGLKVLKIQIIES